MSEEIKQTNPYELVDIETLRVEVAVRIANSEKEKVGHFKWRTHVVNPAELLEQDLRLYEVITREGRAGTLDREALDRERLAAQQSGNWSRKLFLSFLAVLAGQQEYKQKLAESLPDETLNAFQVEIEQLKLAEAQGGRTNHLTDVVTQDLTEEDYWMWQRYKNQTSENSITNDELSEYADTVRGNTSREGFYSFLTGEMTKAALARRVQEMKRQRGLE